LFSLSRQSRGASLPTAANQVKNRQRFAPGYCGILLGRIDKSGQIRDHPGDDPCLSRLPHTLSGR
jgi:hypothetical protein